jgi:hypothetical protein
LRRRAQERIRIPDDKMEYYKDLAEMYVGDDVSPDFYGWVFPKYDHVAVGARPSQGFYQPLASPCLWRPGACCPAARAQELVVEARWQLN